MLSKNAKIKILENFYALDYILFGKHLSKVEMCCPILAEEYLSVKGSLLSTLAEMYDYINYRPRYNTLIETSKQINESAIHSAKESRYYAKHLVSSPMGKQSVKKMLQEDIEFDKNININKNLQENIRKKAFELGIDHLLVGNAILESKGSKKLNSKAGQIMETAYKILRTQLAKTSFDILDNGSLE